MSIKSLTIQKNYIMSEEIFEIKIPFETVNDDTVTINKWLVSNGDFIQKGDVVVEIETTKAAIEIETEHDGTIEILQPEGSEGAVGDAIGKVYINSKKIIEDKVVDLKKEDSKIDLTVNSNAIISKKAKELIDLHSIDLIAFDGKRFIKESDVTDYLKSKEPETSDKESSSSLVTETNNPDNTKQKNNKKNVLGVFSEALNSAKTRNRSFLWIFFNYIFRNWFLNLLVKVSPYGVIIWVHRLRGVKIGKGCFIDPSAIIETAYPDNIHIGDDVRIAAGSIIMSHIKAPNKLIKNNLVPYVNKKVIVESHAFIGVNVTIMPGVTIGEGSVLANGSVVTKNVKPYTMVMGNPAENVKTFDITNII
jgi:acetyltransferase-like isoleucine patch superfamily enzyme